MPSPKSILYVSYLLNIDFRSLNNAVSINLLNDVDTLNRSGNCSTGSCIVICRNHITLGLNSKIVDRSTSIN